MAILLLFLTVGCGPTPTLFEVAPGQELVVCDQGPVDGQPVVLVPGLSGCAFGFRKLTPLLHEQGLRTIIIVPLAVGESTRPPEADYTLTAQARRLAVVLDDLAVAQAVFVGHGIAGSMVMRLAVERPGLVVGFLSIEGGPAEAALSPSHHHNLKMAKAMNKLGGKKVLQDRFLENLKSSSGDVSWLDRRTAGRYFRGFGRDLSRSLHALAAMARQAEPWSLVPRLPEIRIPVMVLQGTAPHAGELTSEEIELMRKGLAMAEFREVPGAGHFIYEEQPQPVADAVRDLVRQVSRHDPVSVGATQVPGDDGAGDLVEAGNTR
jgi:pimeloyl-ACP methyl ester carboxylesterase